MIPAAFSTAARYLVEKPGLWLNGFNRTSNNVLELLLSQEFQHVDLAAVLVTQREDHK